MRQPARTLSAVAASYKFSTTVSHGGRVFCFAARQLGGVGDYALGYTVLSAQSSNAEDNTIWRQFEVLTFPRELRTVGFGVIVIDFKDRPIPTDDVPFNVVSDGAYVYVFRQSTIGTLYADRFIYDEVQGRLVNAFETRFRRSRKYDIPLDRKDTFGSTDMEGKRFLEPTTELPFVNKLIDGRFAVTILPTELANVSRWQIFAYDSASGRLNGFSILRSTSGWFDLSDSLDDSTLTVPPQASYSLTLSSGAALSWEGGLALALYNRQELLSDEYGRAQLQKRALRLMLICAAGPDKQFAAIDFGIGKGGMVAQVDPALRCAAVPHIGTGLLFVPQRAAQVSIPDFAKGPASAMTLECWIKLRAVTSGSAAIMQSATAATLPFALALEDGVPTFSVSAASKIVSAPESLDVGYWHHIAAVWDGTDAVLYVNGEPFDEGGSAPLLNPPATGYLVGGAEGFEGTLDEVRLWDVARTPAEIVAAMCTSIASNDPAWSSLVGYWTCDEPTDATRFTTVANTAGTGAVADGVLNGAAWVQTSAPTAPSMPPVAWDADGLTVCATLLTYASSDNPPVILDGGDSQLHLYYLQRVTGQMMATHYSTVTARASYATTWSATDKKKPVNDQSGSLLFISKHPGAWMNQSTLTPAPVTIARDANKPAFLTVTLRSTAGLVERWPKVPEDVASFVAVINGEATQTTDDPDIADDAVVMYDYTKVTVTAAGSQRGAQPAQGSGSNIFSVMPDVDPDNGVTPLVDLATDNERVRAGIDNWWLYDPPLADIDMTDPGQFIGVFTPQQIDNYKGELLIPGDAALEAWVRPAPFTSGESSTILVFNSPAGSTDLSVGTRYLLALDSTGRVICSKGEVASITRDAIAPGQWAHLAGSYSSDYGIQLAGTQYLDAGNDDSLTSVNAVTIEAWVRLDKPGTEQTIASKWSRDEGRSWRLFLAADGTLKFTVNQQTDTAQVERTVTSSSVLGSGKWHHVAGVYSVDFIKESAIMFNAGSYVKIPALTRPPAGDVTIMMWVKTVGLLNPGIQILIQSVDPLQAVPFVLCLQAGIPLFTAYVNGDPKTIAGKRILRSDDWIHLAASYNATQGVQLYIDGQSVADLVASAPISFDAMVTSMRAVRAQGMVAAYSIGGMAAQQSFTGMINQVSVWDRGLPINTIREYINHPPPASAVGLSGYWPFQDMYGTTVMDLAGTSNGELVGGNFVRIDKGQFAHKVFIDGHVEAFERVSDPVVAGSAAMMMGTTSNESYLQGAIADVRLWNSGRMNWQIEYFAARNLDGTAEGLVSNWTFKAGSGRIVTDAKSDNNAVIRDAMVELSDASLAAMWIHTTFKAGWTIYINGLEAPLERMRLDSVGYGDPQATLGALIFKTAFAREFCGELIEVRAWRTQRTVTQVRENMLTAVTGGESGLVGYWPMTDGSSATVADVTGFGANGTWYGGGPTPLWQGSSAPVGVEPAQIRNVLGGLVTSYNTSGASAPGAGQYGSFAPDAYGAGIATYLRAYCYLSSVDMSLTVFGSFKVGDLDVQYVGQAQMAPTLIGYIEGAPPLPAENLAVDAGYPNIYNSSSTVQLDETNVRLLSYTASRDTGFDTNINGRIGLHFKTETSAGLGVQTLLFGFITDIGAATTFSLRLGTLAEAQVSNETLVTSRKSIDVRGNWVPNTYQIDNGFGQLFYPNNMGYALVRSGTADLYALRIKGTGALVSYQMRPNPDIPEDVNIIMFKIRPGYVKNGTLDGWIGFQPDSSYPNLQPGERGSYFKPLQAYALKQLIDREHQQLRAYFDNFDAGSVGRRENVVNFQPGDIGDTNNDIANVLMGVRQREALTAEEWKKRMARRNMVNTYVWTCDGGLYAEEEQFTALREQQSGGSYDFSGQAGIYAEMKFSAGVRAELDAMFGGHIVTLAQKSQTESAGFTVNVTVTGEPYIGLIEADEYDEPVYTDKPSPGKVRGYRFMTFHMAPSKQNFDTFADVVDDDWLNRTGAYAGTFDPDALALREALLRPNEVWRVLHRVTYVSRTPPQKQDGGESVAPQAQKPDAESLTNNYWMIAELPAGAAPNPLAAVSEEADALLATFETNPVWGALLKARRAEIKQDVMTYMTACYA